MTAGWCTLVVYNIHSFALTAHDVNNIAKHIKEDLAAVERDPTLHNVIIAGDWNFCPEDEPGFDMSSPDTDFVVDTESRAQHATEWTHVLSPFTDINSGLRTHWHEQHHTASRIDRIYVATQG